MHLTTDLSPAFNADTLCLVRVTGYDESIDVFTLTAVGFTPEDEAQFPVYSGGAPDFDDFTVPGIVLPAITGEWGEPAEFLNKVYAVPLPKGK
jgi:hypothetical protein